MSQTCELFKWRLAPGVHAAVVDEDVVLLNIAADAYSCVPGGAASARFDASNRHLNISNLDMAGELARAELICPAIGRVQSREVTAFLHQPRVSALRDAYPSPRIADAPQAAAAMTDLLLHYRGRSFAEILRRAADHAPMNEPVASQELIAEVDRFHRWVPYAPVSGKCLLRSFLLLGHLRRKGLNARWVFGVATWPFRAHCWLQCGETLLDEAVEQAQAYVPILVI